MYVWVSGKSTINKPIFIQCFHQKILVMEFTTAKVSHKLSLISLIGIKIVFYFVTDSSVIWKVN